MDINESPTTLDPVLHNCLGELEEGITTWPMTGAGDPRLRFGMTMKMSNRTKLGPGQSTVG